mmetsp:Transcript_43980/g.133982  ORF Transcript_43980/g.133982 Transcript_43980/m.133982 type:complete len:165 (-) Transcript_43980:5396-5890(-)
MGQAKGKDGRALKMKGAEREAGLPFRRDLCAHVAYVATVGRVFATEGTGGKPSATYSQTKPRHDLQIHCCLRLTSCCQVALKDLLVKISSSLLLLVEGVEPSKFRLYVDLSYASSHGSRTNASLHGGESERSNRSCNLSKQRLARLWVARAPLTSWVLVLCSES